MGTGGVKQTAWGSSTALCQVCKAEPIRVKYRGAYLGALCYQTLARDTPPGAQIVIPESYAKADPNY